MTKYTETTIYKFSNGTIKHLGEGIFEVSSYNKEEFPIPYKARKKEIYWEVFDNEILEEGLILPMEIGLQLDKLLSNEESMKEEFLQ